MALPSVTANIANLLDGGAIPLNELFTDISDDVTNFDVQIRSGDAELIGPNGQVYTTEDGVISDIPITQLSQWSIVASASDQLDLIGFDANDEPTYNSSTSSNVVAAIITGNTLEEGIDTPLVINAQNALAIAQAGYNFVVRYYDDDGSEKVLTPGEVLKLEAANLQIATVWENKTLQQNNGVLAFAGNAGTMDATSAIGEAIAAGQSKGSTIYFAVDIPISPSDLSVIENYFGEIKTVFNNSSINTQGYTIGVYGNSSVYDDPIVSGIVKFIWAEKQSAANWSMDQIATTDNSAPPISSLDPNARITIPGTQDIAGVDVDVAKDGAFGAFGHRRRTAQYSITITRSPFLLAPRQLSHQAPFPSARAATPTSS